MFSLAMTVQLEYINHLLLLFPIMLALCLMLSVTYRIAGFVCEVLICANYARGYSLAEINSMHVNYTDFRFNWIDAGHCLHDSTNFYSTANQCLFTSTSKEWTSISASLPDPKGPLSDYLPTASPEWRSPSGVAGLRKQRGFESSS